MKIRTVFCVLLFAISAGAQPPAARTIDFTRVLHGIDGKPILDKDPLSGTPVQITLGDVAVNALYAQTPQDQNLSGVDKFKLAQLAVKIYKNKAAVLTADQIATIKDRIGKVYGALVVGESWKLLDPGEN